VRLVRLWVERAEARVALDGYPTPMEVARGWESQTASEGAVVLVRRYYAVLYGGRGATTADVARARALLRRLRRVRTRSLVDVTSVSC